jgi:hypothetical protein
LIPEVKLRSITMLTAENISNGCHRILSQLTTPKRGRPCNEGSKLASAQKIGQNNELKLNLTNYFLQGRLSIYMMVYGDGKFFLNFSPLCLTEIPSPKPSQIPRIC